MFWKNIYNQGYPVHELSFLIFYAIPIFFLTFFYTCMINTIRKANTGIRRSAYRASNASSKATDHRKQTIRMLGESLTLSSSSRHFINFGFQSAWSSSSSSPGPPSTSRGSAMFTSSRRSSSGPSISISSISLVRCRLDKTLLCRDWQIWCSGILYYLSSTLNPLLYTLMSVKYRQAFKNVMLCRTSK